MTAVSEDACFNALDDYVNRCNNTVHGAIKDSYATCNVASNEFGDHVRISKSKNIFAKGYSQRWSEEIFIISSMDVCY